MTDTTTALPAPTGPPTAPAGDHAGEPNPQRWAALGVVLTATFMVLLDISIVNVAIPSIQANLGATFSEVQFVIAGYALAYAVFLITGGRLGDVHGRKRLFMLGMAGFTLASALCGAAQSPIMLVLSRVLQGLMASLMYPQVLSVIQVMFPPRERARAFGTFGATIGMATIAGPLLGGLIIRDDVTGPAWRFVFLVNIPIGIGSLIAAARLLPESRAPRAARLDIPGVAVVTVALLCLVYPLVEGRDLGWPVWAYVLIGISPLVFLAFGLLERRVEARGIAPLVALSLFRQRAFTVGVLGSAAFFSGVPSFFFTLSLTLQLGLHYSALHAGLSTAPFAIASAAGSATSVRLAPRLGRRILFLGSGLLVTGVTLTAVVLHFRGTDLQGWELAVPFVLAGAGLGCFVAPLLTIVLAGVPGRDAGSASGVLTTVQQVGGALGVAIVGVIFFGLLGSRAAGNAAAVSPQLRTDLAAAHVPGQQADGIVTTFGRCFEARARASDPSVAPPGCPTGSGPTTPVSAAVSRAAGQALGDDFIQSFIRSLGYIGGAFLAAGLLATRLPGGAAPRH